MAASDELVFEKFRSPGGVGVNVDSGGVEIASAATIAPTALISMVSGAAAISRITPPYASFSGFIILVAKAGATWTLATGGSSPGDIAVGATCGAGKALILVYMPSTGKWYPSYLTAAA